MRSFSIEKYAGCSFEKSVQAKSRSKESKLNPKPEKKKILPARSDPNHWVMQNRISQADIVLLVRPEPLPPPPPTHKK